MLFGCFECLVFLEYLSILQVHSFEVRLCFLEVGLCFLQNIDFLKKNASSVRSEEFEQNFKKKTAVFFVVSGQRKFLDLRYRFAGIEFKWSIISLVCSFC